MNFIELCPFCFFSGTRVQGVPSHKAHQRRAGLLQERPLRPTGGKITRRSRYCRQPSGRNTSALQRTRVHKEPTWALLWKTTVYFNVNSFPFTALNYWARCSSWLDFNSSQFDFRLVFFVFFVVVTDAGVKHLKFPAFKTMSPSWPLWVAHHS